MNESQKIIFAATHAGDSSVAVTYHFGELFLILVIAVFIVMGCYIIGSYILNLLYSVFKTDDTDENYK